MGRCLGLSFHEGDPVGIGAFAAGMAEQRFVWGQLKDLARGNLDLVPLEDQHPLGLEDAEAFSETTAQIVLPVITEDSVLGT